ncbi:response regulator transcription factor [Cohnella luojiensis]|uniref:Response regulator transcription factor n=1 Tax=Cohnella luojiensis TaxID=652876 RepID=A0A4Y8M0B8_9BACL|nr:response regulator transcription factor [Cohnella luojiensis]TFE25809.1 response regulator transcription factor [Cohnella luojiensis]
MIDILLVDDHPSVMEGTKVLLEQEGDMKVFFAQTAAKALEMTDNQPFDVMLIDLHMPDISGIDLAKKVLGNTPNAIILIYTGFEFKNHFNLMIEAGISGYVLKTANKEQLVTAVRCAMRGEAVLPFNLMKQLRRLTAPVQSVNNDRETFAISDKEHHILKEIARGRSNKEMAETLIMSQRSLEYCLTNLFQKLKVKSRFEAAMKAKQMELLSDSDFPQTSP